MYFLSIIAVTFHLIYAAHKPTLPDTAQILDLGFTVHIANVGQGNGVMVVDHTKHKCLVVDAGSSANPDTPETTVKYLAQSFNSGTQHHPIHSSSSEHIFIISHPDEDHMSFFSKSHFFKSQKQWFDNPNSKFYLGGSLIKYLIEKQDFLNELLEKKIQIVSFSHNVDKSKMKTLLQRAQSLVKDDGYSDQKTALTRTLRNTDTLRQNVRPFIVRSIVDAFSDTKRIETEVVAANAGHENVLNCAGTSSFEQTGQPEIVINSEDNASSVVLRLSFYNDQYSILLPGDATGITTDRILFHYKKLQKEKALKSKLVLACHHGSITEESNNPEWSNTLEPETVIFSSGDSSQYHHPQFDAFWNYVQLASIKTEQTTHKFRCARETVRSLPSSPLFSTQASQLDKKQTWYTLGTQKSIFSTYSSGHITIPIHPSKAVDITTEK